MIVDALKVGSFYSYEPFGVRQISVITGFTVSTTSAWCELLGAKCEPESIVTDPTAKMYYGIYSTVW